MPKKEIINPGWPEFERYTFSPGVKKGGLLFISGFTGRNPDGTFPPDMKSQCENTYARMGAVLKTAGASFSDVVKTMDYVTTLENYRDTAEVRRKYLGECLVASTGVVVKRLIREQALLEVDAIAVLDGEKKAVGWGWPEIRTHTYRTAIQKGDLLFLSGQVGAVEGVFAEDMGGQCEKAYAHIKAVLDEAGASFADVVKTTDFLTTLENYRDTAEVRRKYFEGAYSAATGVVVERLIPPEAFLEVDAIAVLGAARGRKEVGKGVPEARGYTYRTAVQKGNLLFISGQLGVGPDGVFPKDMKAQCELAFANMKPVLEEAGTSFADVVKTMDYVTTLENYRDTAEVRRKYFKDGFPAATGVVVKRLIPENALIEIDAIAVIG